jgi:DNA (cytosine-5)-methyltransferase 1
MKNTYRKKIETSKANHKTTNQTKSLKSAELTNFSKEKALNFTENSPKILNKTSNRNINKNNIHNTHKITTPTQLNFFDNFSLIKPKQIITQDNNSINKPFTFIDLFAGIGGFHIALHNIGGECVFASEIDTFARATYEINLSKLSPKLFESNNFAGDIQKINSSQIPNFDILCAGFPCQPFSQIGQKNGFFDTKDNRGNMFFEIARIIKDKRPKAFFLENVRNLETHDNGNTFKIIKNTILDLGYSFSYKIVRASDYGLPQNRPRLFMIGFANEIANGMDFKFPHKIELKYTLSDIFNGKCDKNIGFTLRVVGRGSKINDRRNWEFYYVDNQIKRISTKEAKLLQGFPNDYLFPVSEIQAMKQLGNSVAINAVQLVAKNIIDYIENKLKK